jgi:hypothetical protein
MMTVLISHPIIGFQLIFHGDVHSFFNETVVCVKKLKIKINK